MARPEPLRVMHVLEAFLGGTRRFLLDVLTGLPADRFRQHAVVSLQRASHGEEDCERLRAAGVEVTALQMRRGLRPASDWAALRELRRAMMEWRPQVVHGHSAKGGFLARAAARGLEVDARPAVIYSPHCFPFQMRVGHLQRRLYLGLERLAGPWADVIMAVSEAEADLGRRAGVRPRQGYRAVPLGVDCESFTSEPARSRAELGLPEGRLVGMIGALNRQKAPGLLLEAFGRAARSLPGVCLVFVGDGPLRAALEAQARASLPPGAVHFAGYRTDVAAILPHLDVAVLSSLWEGMPYSLLEAMAAARPVVVPDLPGVADAVAEAGAGVCFQAGGARSLAPALAAMMALPSGSLASFGEAGRRYAQERHSPGEMLSTLASIYEDLAPKP